MITIIFLISPSPTSLILPRLWRSPQYEISQLIMRDSIPIVETIHFNFVAYGLLAWLCIPHKIQRDGWLHACPKPYICQTLASAV